MNQKPQDIERLLLNSRNKFRAMVDGIVDEVMSIDLDFNILTSNLAMAQALERHPRDLIGQKCYQMLYGFDRPCQEMGLVCPAVTSLESKQVEMASHELPLEPTDELSRRYIEVRAMPLEGFDEWPAEVILTRRDVTLQRRYEIQIKEHSEELERIVSDRTRQLVKVNEQLTQQKNELADTNEELIKIQRLREDLTNMVVHDLKGPLSEILANLEMINMEPLSGFQMELLESAQLGGNDLQRMITNLLDISRLEENRLVLEPEPLDIAAEIERIINRFGPRAKLGNVTLIPNISDNLPPISVDQRLFERIINNLLSNALDYSPDDSVINISVVLEDVFFRIEIKDQGPGIPEDLHEVIFQKFTQGHTGRPKTSSGLGLTFCRMAVDAHGGRIWVDSRPGAGSRFIMVFPQDDSNHMIPE